MMLITCVSSPADLSYGPGDLDHIMSLTLKGFQVELNGVGNRRGRDRDGITRLLTLLASRIILFPCRMLGPPISP